MKYILSIVTALSLITSQNEGFAQKPYKGTSIALSAGITSPYTDIRQHMFYRTTKNVNENQPVVGLAGKQMLNHVFGITADGHIGILQGSARNATPVDAKKNRYTEDQRISQRLGFSNPVKFRTNIADAAIGLYTNWTNLGMYINSANMKNAKPRKFGIYSNIGIGFVTFGSNNKNEVSALYSNMPVPATEIFYLHGNIGRTTELMFPVAIGAKYRLSKSVDFALEYNHRFVMSDKLDGVVNNAFIANPLNNRNKYALANTRWQGGNDAYALLTANLCYTINSQKPGAMVIEWTNPMEVMLKSMDTEMAKMRSLMNDSDKDGVSDLFDKEPNTPAGVKVDGSGTALDLDYDGVADFKDDQIYSPKGSTVDEMGIASDSDADGVADVNDIEPNSSANALVNFRGITIGSRSDKGAEGKTVFVFPAVYFDLNSDVVKSIYHDQLADVARTMIKYPELKINVFGNADQRGNDKYNESLGKRRAENVAAYIRKNFNIDAIKILMIESYGKSRPISTLNNPNRRVDIMMAD